MNAIGATAAPAAVAALAGATGMMNPIELFFNSLNTNPYFIGLMMLLLNLGGRFLQMEISKGQEQFFQHTWIRRFFIFTVLFVATRNVFVALFMSVVILLLLGYLFNENSDLYLGGPRVDLGAGAPVQGLTMEETEILRRLTDKQNRMKKPDVKEEKPHESSEAIYSQNLAVLASVSSAAAAAVA